MLFFNATDDEQRTGRRPIGDDLEWPVMTGSNGWRADLGSTQLNASSMMS